MLHSSAQNDANCSRSTNAAKLVIDFLDELLEKNNDSEIVRFHHIKTLLVEIDRPTPNFFKCRCQASFFIFFLPKRAELSDAPFQMLVFLKEHQ